MYYQNKATPLLNASSGNLSNNCLPTQSYSTSQLLNTRQSQPQLNMINTPIANSQTTQLTQPTQSYNYNHWLIQEAELRRQMATQNGSSLIASTKNQQNLQQQLKNNQLNKQPVSNIYKDDQPVYENTIIYNSHKKQQQLHQQLSNNYLNNQQQIKPPYPNPNQLMNSSPTNQPQQNYLQIQQQKQQKQILSVSGKKKCSNCLDELG